MTKSAKPNNLKVELLGVKADDKKPITWQPIVGLITLLAGFTWKCLWPKLEIEVEITPPIINTETRSTSPRITTPRAERAENAVAHKAEITPAELLILQDRCQNEIKTYVQTLVNEFQLGVHDAEELEVRGLGQPAERLLHDLPRWLGERRHALNQEQEVERKRLLERWQELQQQIARFGQSK